MEFITSRREYQKVYNSHHKLEGKLFRILKQATSEDNLKVGIVVGKKVGKAVIRNKIKRRIKAFLREKATELPTHQKLVIMAKKAAADACWNDFKLELMHLLKVQ